MFFTWFSRLAAKIFGERPRFIFGIDFAPRRKGGSRKCVKNFL